MSPTVKKAKELLAVRKEFPAGVAPLQISWEPIDQDITEADSVVVIDA